MGVPTVHMATTSSSSRQRPEARAMAEAARTMKVFMMWRRTELVTANTTMALYLSGWHRCEHIVLQIWKLIFVGKSDEGIKKSESENKHVSLKRIFCKTYTTESFMLKTNKSGRNIWSNHLLNVWIKCTYDLSKCVDVNIGLNSTIERLPWDTGHPVEACNTVGTR